MGTKNDPGAFDCYANAHPDEPMFILLARDKHAPTLVWLWSMLRELDGEDNNKVAEARDCVEHMMSWQRANGRVAVGLAQATLAGLFGVIRVANMAVRNAPNAATRDDQVAMLLGHTSAADLVNAMIPATNVELEAARTLLDEVRCAHTRDDQLPDNLLPRIDAFLDGKAANPSTV